jgi:D-alanine transaminase
MLLTARALPPDLDRLQARGVRVTLLPFARDAGPGWGALKLVGHASAVVGKQIAQRRRAFEGLYVTPDGDVTEGTTSNVFAVVRGALVTPPTDGTILGGVTRDRVIAAARRLGLRVRTAPLATVRLRRAEEIFVTASTIEVVPVVRIDGRRVGAGMPGEITRALQSAYRVAVARALRR